MNTRLLRLAFRHTDGIRTWAGASPVNPMLPITLLPAARNIYAGRHKASERADEGHPVSPMLWWPCPLTGRLHGIALSRHRGPERHAMRREVAILMREGTPKAKEAARMGSIRPTTDGTPNAQAA